MYPTKKLWEVCEIKKWKKVNYSEQWKYNYIDIGILRTNIIEQYTNDEWIFCNKNDILIAWDGSKSGTVGFWLEWVIGSTLAKITIDTKMFSSEFIGKFLQGNFDYLNKNTSGAAIPHLRKDILINLEIPLPPLSTQKLIVEKLDMIFAEIEKSKNLLEKNLQNVDEMNKSVLEKIFANDKWEKKKLGEVCEIWPKKNEVIHLNENMFVSFVPMKDLKENEKWFDALEQKSIKEVYKWYTYFAENDVLLAKVTPCFENWKAWIAKNLVNNIWFGSSEFYVLRANKDILPEYIYYVIKQEKFLKHWKNNMSGAVGLQRVTKDFVVNFQIPLPPLETQKNIVSYLDNIFAENQKLKNLYQAQIKNLDEMKQSFLKKAFAGELV